MNTGGDAAEQIVRMSLEGFEVAVKITGAGAKNIAVLLYSILKEEQKTKGKARLTNLLRSGKPLKIYTLKNDDLRKFAQEAKKYGVLYYAMVDRKNKDPKAEVDILAPIEDAAKISRIVERFKLSAVESDIVVQEEKTKDGKTDIAEPDIGVQEKESKEFLDDLTTRDQRMMFAVLTMVHTAETKEQLDNDTEALLTTARKHLCQFAVLKYQQMDGLNTALPFGVRRIDAMRTLTTESLAVFIPFRVQEIHHENGVYYGQNSISKNMIIANRRHLLNGNSFILGVSGAGKSFTAKEEMVNIILT